MQICNEQKYTIQINVFIFMFCKLFCSVNYLTLFNKTGFVYDCIIKPVLGLHLHLNSIEWNKYSNYQHMHNYRYVYVKSVQLGKSLCRIFVRMEFNIN